LIEKAARPELVAGRAAPPSVVVIAGPTASGKSAAALHLAAALNGALINADAMQLYRDLHILTARPDHAALARAPHHLYGILAADEPCSAGRYRALALDAIAAAAGAGRLPIVVGGSGLYLRALMHGLAPIPPVPAAVRERVRALYETMGEGPFRATLAARDPVSAASIKPGDRQRLMRAWEVVEATGRPLPSWHALPAQHATMRFLTIVSLPDRAALYAACDARFERMMAQGGLGEARAIAARRLDPDLPIMKAVGLRPLLRHLQGEISLIDACDASKRETRHYAKRQLTWFRHQLAADRTYRTQYSESLTAEILSFISEFLLTTDSRAFITGSA
jgi:tRNA dimethylallyltransferase